MEDDKTTQDLISLLSSEDRKVIKERLERSLASIRKQIKQEAEKGSDGQAHGVSGPPGPVA